MRVTISARRCALPNSVRLHAEQRLARLVRFEPRLVGVEVNFEAAHGVYRAEARVNSPGIPLITAQGSGENFRVALDRAADRLRRQLRDRRERHRSRQPDRRSTEPTLAGGS